MDYNMLHSVRIFSFSPVIDEETVWMERREADEQYIWYVEDTYEPMESIFNKWFQSVIGSLL